jgi:phosphoenolpyruvate carboxykinase (ATP)
MPRHPSIYGNLLRALIARHKVNCWLVNTGWTGGEYGVGHRMPIGVTRRLLGAALDGSLGDAEFVADPNFGFDVPSAVSGIDSKLLRPRDTWANKAEYDETAKNLLRMFRHNFRKFEDDVDPEVKSFARSA